MYGANLPAFAENPPRIYWGTDTRERVESQATNPSKHRPGIPEPPGPPRTQTTHSRALHSCSPSSGLQDRTESGRATGRTTLRGQARSTLLMSSQGLSQMAKEVEEMTRRPSVQRVAKQALVGGDHSQAGPQRSAFTPEPWQAGQAVGKQGTESPLLKPK